MLAGGKLVFLLVIDFKKNVKKCKKYTHVHVVSDITLHLYLLYQTTWWGSLFLWVTIKLIFYLFSLFRCN